MITKIVNGRLVFSDRVESGINLYFENNKIIDITDKELPFDEVIDAENLYVSPGFIDIHVHGGGGYDFSDGGGESVIKAADMHLYNGTTSIVPTTIACSNETLISILKDIKRVKEEKLSKSRILGVHLEGPYFSIKEKGAQNPLYITPPIKEDYERVIKLFGPLILRWSFAPELPGTVEFCKTLVENNILPSAAHSDGVYEDVKKLYDLSLRSFTHLYSGMTMVKRINAYRHLGLVESCYLLPDTMAEIIADGCHLPPELLKLIVKIMGTDALCLVTDGMRAAGMEEGKSYLGRKGEEIPCIVKDGVAFAMDGINFAGSVATSERLVKTMVKAVGLPVYEAVKMITKNPAEHLKIDNIGVLKKGNLADIVFFDEDINVKKVIADGKIIR